MTLRVRPEARADILVAARWYDDREAGLGPGFVAEIDAVFQRIERGPQRYPIAYRQLRRAPTRRFPYSIFFSFDADAVIVFAVLHQSRDPKVLAKRLDE